jgi:hypothetical protein
LNICAVFSASFALKLIIGQFAVAILSSRIKTGLHGRRALALFDSEPINFSAS